MSESKDILEIVNFLARSKSAQKLTDISKAVGLSYSTIHRILASLKKAEWIVQDQLTKKYKIGISMFELAFFITSQIDIKEISFPFLQSLSQKTKESVRLSLRVGFERIYLEQIRSDYELQTIAEIGKRLPLCIGASGKAILAYLDDDEVEAALNFARQSGIKQLASGEKINFSKLRKELDTIRNQGFSISAYERVVGVHSVAAPIFSGSKVVGSISLGGPAVRFSLETARQSAHLVKETANQISFHLGANPDLQ